MDGDVDLRLPRSFVTMAEESNVGRAARRLYISQPALSKQLRAWKPSSMPSYSTATTACCA